MPCLHNFYAILAFFIFRFCVTSSNARLLRTSLRSKDAQESCVLTSHPQPMLPDTSLRADFRRRMRRRNEMWSVTNTSEMRTPPCSASSAGTSCRGPVRRQEQVGSSNLAEKEGSNLLCFVILPNSLKVPLL